MHYKIGDVVEHVTTFGAFRSVLVTSREDYVYIPDELKRPGFVGTLTDDPTIQVWGYDESILRVLDKAETVA